ncbi:MAG: AraC family transcriptional regulator, partial [Armatimonadota bacterium]|nr:AraC family transcriptional regulator [Armatimonadota bacterium]
VPITDNNELRGGIVGRFQHQPRSLSVEGVGEVRAAAHALLEVAIQQNLTNAALLNENRRAAEYEASKATAIHGLKERMYTSIREMYLREEEPLHAAIRARDRRAAREVLNRILVGVYAVGTQDLELLKAVVLEFIVVVYRAAVEAGGDPVAMLGLNYKSYLDLFRVTDEEHLAHWLVGHLEGLMDCLELEPRRPPEARLQQAVRYMREHCDEDLGRDEVAALVGLSPSHFSHLLREHLDTTFRDLLNEMRVSRARDLLAHTEHSLARVAQECGFADQSYFTKVFHKRVGMTPREYRATHGRRSL